MIIMIINFILSLWVLCLSLLSLYSLKDNGLASSIVITLSAFATTLIYVRGTGFNCGKFFVRFIISVIFFGISGDLAFALFDGISLNYKYAIAWLCLLVIITRFDDFWMAGVKA